ncbi:MAG TPA: sugar isomerase, partial [Rhodospirillaceae bacterium]|nr:sugar isomerase [Rhodospirillaceae bacterium]
AGNAGHAVNDFRKLCNIEAYAPTDNVSELTARTNDEGFETVFAEYLKTSRATDKDALLVFSVGGGNLELNVSVNLINAIQEARERDMSIFGVVGRDGGYTKQAGDVVIVVPNIEPDWTTPLSEGFQAVVWHALVSHPDLQINATKW